MWSWRGSVAAGPKREVLHLAGDPCLLETRTEGETETLFHTRVLGFERNLHQRQGNVAAEWKPALGMREV